MTESIRNIAVVGLGLVGASFAAAYRQARPLARVLGVDVSRETLSTALDREWITESAMPDDPELRSFVSDECDLVIMAVPVGAVEGYFEKLAAWGYEGIITDTGSTKNRIVSMADAVLPRPWQYLPGHPMAGSEKNGIEGAQADLFQGAYWIVCPDEETPVEYFPLMHDLLTSIGSRVITLPREEHDAALAVVSHVPHLVASSLVELAVLHADEQQALFRLAAGGFKDSTRIAAGSPTLWCGISFDNREAIMGALKEFQSIIGQFQDALERGDKRAMTDLLEDAAAARSAIPSAWVPSTEKLLEVRIPMENRKGAVAEATAIASQVGCNIQSIEIDHITADSAVLSLILTDEGDIGRLSMELIGAGYSVSFNPLTAKEHHHVDD